jgi:dimethylargininase
MFNNIIARKPCPALTEGITSHPELGKPDYQRALAQHDAYIKALRACGVKATVLEAAEEYPDSCFVEDVAVLSEKCAVITNPGAPTRKGEVPLIIPVIKKFFPEKDIHYIKAPGSLEGGDVMRVEETFYVGRSARTNGEGIRQLGEILGLYDFRVIEVPLNQVLHLKTGINYLTNNTMLVSGEFVNKEYFASYSKVIVPPEEEYAANSLWVNGTALVPAGFPRTEALIRGLGYPVILVDSSEYRKIDGGLSCLSLRF